MPAVLQRAVRASFAAALVLASGAAVAQAPQAAGAEQQAGTLVFVGQDGRPTALGIADLEQMPSVTVRLSREREHGTPTAYAGPLLWAVLGRTGAVGTEEPRARVGRTVTVTGRDGYAVVLALAELDPEFEGKPVIVATQADGKPIGGGALRLVVPGDKRAGRSVRDPTKVVVR